MYLGLSLSNFYRIFLNYSDHAETMAVETRRIRVHTNGNADIIDISGNISIEIENSSIVEGNALIFVGGSTAGITTIEFEPGLRKDYPEFF